MSGIVKGIKKVFHAVVDVVKKIAAPVLAAAAIVFTGGAALGLAPLAGGWAGAAATVGSAIGGSSIVGSVLTSAIYTAGQGAVIGGLTAAVTGGSVTEGMQRGAAAGALTGGVMGAAGHVNAAAQPKMTPHGGPTIGGEGVKTFPLDTPRSVGGTAVDAAGNAIPGTTAAGTTASTVTNAGRRGLLSGIGGFVKENPELVGNIMKGVGGAMTAGEADKEYLRERQRITDANYGNADPGARFRDLAPGTSGNTPGARFGPGYYSGFEYVYDRQQGRIVRQPVNNGGA